MANTVLYLDCASGISGDMLLGALVDAGADLTTIQAGTDSLGLPDCRLELAEVKRHAFRAAKVTVHHAEEHAHRHLHHITEMIDRSRLTERQQDLAKQIFQRLGEAEAKVHGSTLRKVHFHEVGAADSIADIVGAAIGLDLLQPSRIVCSPVPTGHGTITIAHGRCSIPAPATAELLKGIPLAPPPPLETTSCDSGTKTDTAKRLPLTSTSRSRFTFGSESSASVSAPVIPPTPVRSRVSSTHFVEWRSDLKSS